jgi:glycosyltransferase involved in cell wall biosynthesis
MKPILLIPSYNPDKRLPETIELLLCRGFERFVVVNDGSGPQSAPIFEQVADMPGVHLLRHAVNMGKGRAMKTGFNYILNRFPGAGAVVCDADGQHPADSVKDVAAAMEREPEALVLGVRRFKENKQMPRANYLGNQITRMVFFLVSGMRYADTQCGLRGYPAPVMAKLMTIAGERFEFENTMLLAVRSLGVPVAQVGMPAVYQDEGEYTSHFNKVRDSARIYKMLLAHSALAIFAGLAGFGVFAFVMLKILGQSALGAGASALVGYLVAWLILFPTLPAKGRAIVPALAVCLGSAAWYMLFNWLLVRHPVGAWWLAAPVTAAAGYWLYLQLHEGPVVSNKRLDKAKKE